MVLEREDFFMGDFFKAEIRRWKPAAEAEFGTGLRGINRIEEWGLEILGGWLGMKKGEFSRSGGG